MSVWYNYEVNVGNGCGIGGVWVSENATDDEIQLEIMDHLYSVSYYKREPAKPDRGEAVLAEYDYEVDVNDGCGTGSICISENATDDEIRLAIMNDLYSVRYWKQEPTKEV